MRGVFRSLHGVPQCSLQTGFLVEAEIDVALQQRCEVSDVVFHFGLKTGDIRRDVVSDERGRCLRDLVQLFPHRGDDCRMGLPVLDVLAQKKVLFSAPGQQELLLKPVLCDLQVLLFRDKAIALGFENLLGGEYRANRRERSQADRDEFRDIALDGFGAHRVVLFFRGR